MPETKVKPLKMRISKQMIAAPIRETESTKAVDWPAPPKPRRGEALLKNLAVASALVLCAVTLRTGAIPTLSDATDVVLAAATDQSLLDDHLGKLSFVSTLFPEAVLVFGESSAELAMPVSGGVVVHTWSATEPYMSLRTSNSQVTAASAGEVIGVYHGNGDERLLQIMGYDGLACLYGNLEEIAVQTGDLVTAGSVIGEIAPGEDLVFEVRQDGVSIDPARFFEQ